MTSRTYSVVPNVVQRCYLLADAVATRVIFARCKTSPVPSSLSIVRHRRATPTSRMQCWNWSSCRILGIVQIYLCVLLLMVISTRVIFSKRYLLDASSIRDVVTIGSNAQTVCIATRSTSIPRSIILKNTILPDDTLADP
jgi:hypothetical protein